MHIKQIINIVEKRFPLWFKTIMMLIHEIENIKKNLDLKSISSHKFLKSYN